MIKGAPLNIMKAARQVTLRHPNSIEARVWRRVLLRTGSESMGGIPTLGGVGVIDSDDEDDTDYDPVGECMVQLLERYEPSGFNDRETTVDMQYPQTLALIECIKEPDDVDYFIAEKRDVVILDIGIGIQIGFEVVDMVSDVNISPYTRKYVLNKRDELTSVNGNPLHP